MSPSPSRHSKLVHVLTTNDRICEVIGKLHELSVNGRQEELRMMLEQLAPVAVSHRRTIRQAIAAQVQTAQAYDLTQRPTVRVLASIGVAQPHPHAANSEAHSPSPEQPSPSVA